MKFCSNCGATLEIPNPKFCPNCGTPLSETATPSGTPAVKYDANVPAPPAMGNGMYRDLKEARILEYKKAIGLPATTDNMVYGQIQHLASALLGPAAMIATNKNAIIDFETDGVFVFGLNAACNFNGKNVWAEGATIEMSGGLMNNSLTIVANGEKVKYTVNKRLIGVPWQSGNAKAALAKFE